MIVKQLIEVFDILDSADASGLKVKEYLESKGATNVEVVKREKDGKSAGDSAWAETGNNRQRQGTGFSRLFQLETYGDQF